MDLAWDEISQRLQQISSVMDEDRPDWEKAVRLVEEFLPRVPHVHLEPCSPRKPMPEIPIDVVFVHSLLDKLELALKTRDKLSAIHHIVETQENVENLKRRERARDGP